MNFKSKPMKIVYYVAISIAIFISGYFYHKLQSLSRIPEIHISNGSILRTSSKSSGILHGLGGCE